MNHNVAILKNLKIANACVPRAADGGNTNVMIHSINLVKSMHHDKKYSQQHQHHHQHHHQQQQPRKREIRMRTRKQAKMPQKKVRRGRRRRSGRPLADRCGKWERE